MPPEFTADTPTPTVAARALTRLAAGRTVTPPPSVASMCGRGIRLLGRLVSGLPTSTWLLVDLGFLTAALSTAYWMFPPLHVVATPHVALWQALAVLAFALIIASLVFGLYERETITSRSRIVARMVLTTGAATVIGYAIIYVVMYSTVSRRAAAAAMAMFLASGVSMRLCACWAIHKVRRGLLVVGPRSLFESFEEAQLRGLLCEYTLIGYVSTGTATDDRSADPYHFGTIADCSARMQRPGVTDVVVGEHAARDPRVRDGMLPWLQQGLRVTNEATFYEKATGQILVDEITPSWFLFADLKVHCDDRATLKRLMDLSASLLGLCLTAPLWPIIALAIKLDDGGPVLYAQKRVGQNGRVFRLYKFRTMRPGAENGKSVWASPDDPRVTRVGRILRRTRLDELPQLYNILLGQMSVVGPRPERPDIVDELREKLPFYAERHLVKPGLTGWAQISFRYGASIEDAKRKLQFDLYYLKHASFELDLMILLRTAGTFLRGAC
ncbi:MAG: exopolysaccharide biosynthesis polyprenyl glycosylphosphotransferase [Phycisphaerae bacterium]